MPISSSIVSIVATFYSPLISSDESLKGAVQNLRHYRDLLHLFLAARCFIKTTEVTGQTKRRIAYNTAYSQLQQKLSALKFDILLRIEQQGSPQEFAPYACRDRKAIALRPIDVALEFIDHVDAPPFLQAILLRKEQSALSYLQRGAEWKTLLFSGRNALEMAVQRELPQVVKNLSAKYTDLSCIQAEGRTLLHVAARLGSPEILGILLQHRFYLGKLSQKKTGINAVNYRGEHALIESIRTGREEQMKLLTQAGSLLDQTSKLGWTALSYAVFKAKKDEPSAFVAHLIQAKASLEMRITPYTTVMTQACQWGKLSVVKQLVQAKAQIELDGVSKEDQPLQVAIKSKHEEIAAFLNRKLVKRVLSHL